MYVRKKFMRRGEKTYGPYWQVVRSARVNGKPRQRVVSNVGAAKDRKQADACARMKGLLCGIEGCGNAGVVEVEVKPERIMGREFKKVWLLCSDHAAARRRGEALRGWTLFPTRDWR
jgi:hypothetical protein